LGVFNVDNVDNVLMNIALSRQMDVHDRDIVGRKMIEGFNDLCHEADVECTGGQTVLNPWPIIGGTAMSCCSDEEFILPVSAVPGDLLILTKPLGTQVAVNINEWLQLEDKTNWNKCAAVISVEQAHHAYGLAVASMVSLNRNAARLMHKYRAHAATDVTGFGLLGHANNLVQNQKASVDFQIHTLPIIPHMVEVDKLFSYFNLVKGYSTETSGGLLIAIPADKADAFCQEIEQLDGFTAWIIGSVIPANDPAKNKAYLIPTAKVTIADMN